MPKRIQRRRVKGWRMPENAVYVGRQHGSPNWGNSFRLGVDGSAEECIEKFRSSWLKHPASVRRQMLSPLRGKDLACWCALDKPCHADVLIELANEEAV
jgi:hypothetical protein